MIGGERRSRRGADLDATSLHGANLVVVGIGSARVARGRVAERRRASRVASGGVASRRERFLHDVARRGGRRVVPRARRGRTRASRRRVGFGRVARARTLDARALSARAPPPPREAAPRARGPPPCAPSAREASRSSSACRAAAGRAARSARALSTVRLPAHDRRRSTRQHGPRNRFADWSADSWPRQFPPGADAFLVRVELLEPKTDGQNISISQMSRILSTTTNQPESCFSVRALHKGYNSASRVHRSARARTRRTRRHPRTSGDRRSVRRDCRRRAGSARVDGRAHGVHRALISKAEFPSRTLSAGA